MSTAAETIAAVATAPGRSGVGVIRISGALVPDIARAITRRDLEPRVATFCRFVGAGQETLDQGLALFFAAPNSYTGEPVLELQAHGGTVVLRLLLARCIELGARLAQPGEFTQRAFLNGKLDLAQAESVADLIDASTSTAARAAARSLTGAFSREVRSVVDELTDLRMHVEATLDFPEEDVEWLKAADVHDRIASIDAQLHRILATATQGALLRDGATAVLIGQPNVGKSSLLNALAGDEVAIVTEIAGTTRDTVTRAIDVGGVPLTIVDTAGLRATRDPIETIGIERTWSAVQNADLALVIVDAREGTSTLGEADSAIVKQLAPGVPRVIVHNKIDLHDNECARQPRVEVLDANAGTSPSPLAERHVWLSAKTGSGVGLLRQSILAMAGADEHIETVYLARERHLVALRKAHRHIAEAQRYLAAQTIALELLAEELRGAQEALATITGEFTADDLLGVIFARFCIGK